MKFGRTYQMLVTGFSDSPATPSKLVIDYPLTLEFNVSHHIFASANTANFSIYNLNKTKRSEIAFNQFLKKRAYPVILSAGYISQQAAGEEGTVSSLPIIFNGFANIAYTERSGPDLITRINAIDNGDVTSEEPATSFPGAPNQCVIPAGTPFIERVKKIMSFLKPRVKTGFIKLNSVQLPEPLTRDEPCSGSVWSKLQSVVNGVSGAYLYIENGECNILGQNDVIPETENLGVLNSATGLIDIPKYIDSTIMCSCIFEPALKIGKLIEINSTLNSRVNSLCKIIAYTHHGVISGSKSGDAISDITLLKVDTPIGAIQP